MNSNRMNSVRPLCDYGLFTFELSVRSLFVLSFLIGSMGCLGCYRSAVVPPSTSIGRPGWPAGTAPVTPLPISPPSTLPPSMVPETPTVTPITRDNPWKPDAALREWKYLVLHHTASNSGDVESIHESHLKNKDKSGNPWLGIGYHFVIGNGHGMNDGDIEPTFRWKQQMQGAHAGVSDYNQHGIGIVLVGNFEESSPTKAQLASVKRLVRVLAKEYEIGATQIVGHGDVKPTECPGTHFPISEIRDIVAVLDEQDLR